MNAYKKFLSTRPPASADSNKRVKQIKFLTLTALEDFEQTEEDSKEKKVDMKLDLIARMKSYRPSGVCVSSIITLKFWFEFIFLKKKLADGVRTESKSKVHTKSSDEG